MHNPFTRLKHYKPDKNHPKENHATECLAACLHFSSALKQSFVSFLFEGMQEKPPAAELLEVLTQQVAGDYGIPDIVLQSEENEDRCCIAVEVKVEDQLTEKQASKYSRWLLKEKQGQRYLFSLEKEQHRSFEIQTAAIPGRRRKWRELYDWFRAREKEYEGTTEAILIASFCAYLEDEGIVSTWKPSHILDYGPGLRAKDALGHCFARVADALKGMDKSLETQQRIGVNEWPRLEVGRTDWVSIFGSGYLGRVWVFYEAEGVWGAKVNRFGFYIFTWDAAFQSDWSVAQKKLKPWAEKLIALGFKHDTSCKRGREIKGAKGLDTLEEAPKTVEAYWEDDKRTYITCDEMVRLTDQELVDEIVKRIRELCAVVLKLGER